MSLYTVYPPQKDAPAPVHARAYETAQQLLFHRKCCELVLSPVSIVPAAVCRPPRYWPDELCRPPKHPRLQAAVCHPPRHWPDEPCRPPKYPQPCSAAETLLTQKSPKIHTSSWLGRRRGLAQASFNQPRWCRAPSVCPRPVLAPRSRGHFHQNSISAIFPGKFPRGWSFQWLRMRLVWSLRFPVIQTSPSTCRLLTLVGLGVSLGGFSAEGKTVLGSQAPRVDAVPGVLLLWFYFTKQTNKQTKP